MTFRALKYLAPTFATMLFAGLSVAPANAAPIAVPQKAVFDHATPHVTLVDNRDRNWRGDRDRGRDRHWRGRDHDRRYYRGNYYRPYYPPPRPPRYVYAPPAYYYPYEPYYPYSGFFSYSSPSLGFSFGY